MLLGQRDHATQLRRWRRLPGWRPPVGRERLGVDPGRVLGRHGLPELQQAGAELLEDPSGDALALAGQAEQQVLGADAVVAEPVGLPGEVDRVLGALGDAHRRPRHPGQARAGPRRARTAVTRALPSKATPSRYSTAATTPTSKGATPLAVCSRLTTTSAT